MKKKVDFDQFAENYNDCLNEQIAFSGEDTKYFDHYKINCVKKWIVRGREGLRVFDYGCGIGKLSFLLAESLLNAQIDGFDISRASVENAEKRNSLPNLRFYNEIPQEKYDVIVVSMVFHHIPSEKRGEVLVMLKNLLKEDGQIVIFEHNPLNPLTRYVVKSCAFDEDAVMIFLGEFLRLASGTGLKYDEKRYIVFFPKFLQALRSVEDSLGFLPLGAQYMLSFSRQS